MMMNRKRGIALIWAMITATVLIFIGTITADAIFRESRMTVNIEESTKAYGAASSGVETAKWCIDYKDVCTHDPVAINTSLSTLEGELDGSTYDVTITKLADTKYLIKSSGTTGTVNRTLEYEYVSSPYNPIRIPTSYKPQSQNAIFNDDTGATVRLNDSFSFQFDIWKNGDVGSYYAENFVYVGLGVKSDPNSKIKLSILDADIAGEEKVELIVTGYENGVANVTPGFTSAIFPLRDFGITDLTGGGYGYAMRVRIQYIKDSSIEVTIIKKDWVTDQTCTLRFSKDMTGIKFAPTGTTFGGFDYIDGYPNQTNNTVTTTVGDGSVMPMKHDSSDQHTWGFLDNFGYK